jgi:predicted permease
MTSLVQDLRYAIRQLRKSPGFAAVAILTLALGIGANTAIFSLIDAVMLKMLPVRQAQELRLFSWAAPGFPVAAYNLHGNTDRDASGNRTSTSLPYGMYERARDRNDLFSGVTAFADADRFNVSVGGDAALADGQLVSGDYFSTLGVQPIFGRTLTPGDDIAGASPAAVISYGYWQRRFGSDRSAISKSISVNGEPFTVVGVAPPEFFGVDPGRSVEVWVPLHTQPLVEARWADWMEKGGTSLFTTGDVWWVVMIGRLKPGISEQQARSALDVLINQSVTSTPPPGGLHPGQTLEIPHIQLSPASKGLDSLRSQFSRSLLVLMAVVALVLLIACANVANLLLARTASRQREFAVRLSLGAGRRRLVRQLITESLLLTSLGGVFGLLLAYWASHALLVFMSSGRDPVHLDVTPNPHVLGFTVIMSIGTGILFGLAPALRGTRLNLTPALKEGVNIATGRVSGPGWRRLSLGKALVMSQMAMSLLLLVGAGLFVRTLTNLENENLGFDRNNLLLFRLDPTQSGYKGERLVNFYQELQRRTRSIPGVLSVSFSQHTLINGGGENRGISIRGYKPLLRDSPNSTVATWVNKVGPDFFATYRIPVLLGRAVNEGDTETSSKVAVINQTLARYCFGNADPIGHRFGFGADAKHNSEIEIVGVVADTKYAQLRKQDPPTIYLPYLQDEHLGALSVELRTADDPKEWTGAVRNAVHDLDRNIPLFDLKTQTEQIEQATFQERLFSRLTSLFSTLALLLACVGLYGVTSYAVARRTNELGIRLALGAGRGDVLWMVLRDSLFPVVTGAAIGLPVALGATRYISSALYGVKAMDPTTVTAAILVLAAVAGIAGFLPACRAAKVDPMVALRYE